MPPLLIEFRAPLLQLRDDTFDAGGLFNRAHADLRGLMCGDGCLSELHGRVLSVGVEPFSKLLQHLDGSAQLGGGGCLHSQMRMRSDCLLSNFW